MAKAKKQKAPTPTIDIGESTLREWRTGMSFVAPPPLETVSTWADNNRRLSSEASAEPGRWNTDRAPYQRGMLDAINDPNVETVVLQTSAQIGKTEVILNLLGYFIDYDPSPIMVIQPSVEMAQTFSKDRLAPMIRDTPCLRGRVKDPRSRDSGNTMLHKQFAGGHITMVGSNAPSSLASRPIRILLADEIDRYPVSAGSEGDPVTLATKRTATFWNRKRVLVSTPTIKGFSRIEAAYQDSTRERFHVPCPTCDHYQPLEWDRLDIVTVKMRCVGCGEFHPQNRWASGMIRGRWVARAEHRNTRGFHLNEMYSPWRRWTEIIADHKSARELGTEAIKAWTNTSLGESWEEEGEAIEPHALQKRSETFRAKVPASGLVLTCGVDTQGDRLEAQVVAWARGEESWVVDYKVLWGDPDRPEVWAELSDLLCQTWQHETGAHLGISATCIDSGGQNTQAVYDFCRGKQGQRIFATKGRGGVGIPFISSPSRKASGPRKRPVDLFVLGVDDAKSALYSRLRSANPGPGYIHFNKDVCDEEYYLQLTAEKCIVSTVMGQAKRQWKVVRSNGRNEALDTFILCAAGLKILSPNFAKYKSRLFPATNPETNVEQNPQVETSAEEVSKKIADIKPQNTQPMKPRPARAIRRPGSGGGYVSRW